MKDGPGASILKSATSSIFGRRRKLLSYCASLFFVDSVFAVAFVVSSLNVNNDQAG